MTDNRSRGSKGSGARTSAGVSSVSRRRLVGASALLCVPARATPASSTPQSLHEVAKPARVALVLGGGGCRGYAHIGVLKALESAGHKPDLIVGSSVGSLVGALHAAGMTAAQLEREGRSIDTDALRRWTWPDLGIFSGAGIARFVEERVASPAIEALPTRFAAVGTDLATGALAIFARGELARAVQASSSLPGLFEPVRIDGRLYVDGNLAAPVPVGVARRLGALHVIAVDITFPPAEANLRNPIDALYQGFSILTRRLALAERAQADVMIEPPIPVHHDMSAATLKALVDAGEHAARAAMPAIAKIFAAGR